jgi:hypothetical protein
MKISIKKEDLHAACEMDAEHLKIAIDFMEESKSEDEGIHVPKNVGVWKLIYKIVWLDKKIDKAIDKLHDLEDAIDNAEAQHMEYNYLAALYEAWDHMDEKICEYTEKKEALKRILVDNDIELS